MTDCFNGPIMVQNADGYAPLTGDRIAELIDDVPSIEYVKEERQPVPRHIADVDGRRGSDQDDLWRRGGQESAR